jgi:hypothetical protein
MSVLARRAVLHDTHMPTIAAMPEGARVNVKLCAPNGTLVSHKWYNVDLTLHPSFVTLTSGDSEPRILGQGHFLVVDINEQSRSNSRAREQPSAEGRASVAAAPAAVAAAPAASNSDLRAALEQFMGPLARSFDLRFAALGDRISDVAAALRDTDSPADVSAPAHGRALDGIDEPRRSITVSLSFPEQQLVLGKPQALLDTLSIFALRPRFSTVNGVVFYDSDDSKGSHKKWRIMVNLQTVAAPGDVWRPFCVFHLLAGTPDQVNARLATLANDITQQLAVIERLHAPKAPRTWNASRSGTWVMPINAQDFLRCTEAVNAYVAAMKRIANSQYPQSPSAWQHDVLWLVAVVLAYAANKNRPHSLGGAVIFEKFNSMLNDSDEPGMFDPAALFRALP